ncbi:MAG: pirin family protein [Bacteroidia bacterium]
MSNINMVIEERPASIGNFLVGRLLPFREKRTVGPFAFIDHMGPTVLSNHENFDVGPHPHIGLSTLTYLFEGSIMHRDSLGTGVEIKPGQVNWMTAGSGIVHSERTPEYLRQSDKHLHGLQIWVALPKHLEECEPSFTHVEGTGLPEWEENGIHYKLIAGEISGKKSAVPVYSPLYLLELKSTVRQSVNFNGALFGESGLYILEGAVHAEGHTFGPKQLMVAKDSTLCEFEMDENTTVYIFGGEPFPEPRHIYWNFVASDPQRIEEAKERWVNKQFPDIAGEYGHVPLPEQNNNFKPKH